MGTLASAVALVVFAVIVIGGGALLGWGARRGLLRILGRSPRQNAKHARERDQEKAQLELGWLRGTPDLAPHVLYCCESEYDADLRRMTLMGYVPIEVYRTETRDGFSFDVRYQLADMAQFERAARELAEREPIAG